VTGEPQTVAVIGAGIVGVLAALQAQRDGHRVFLVEPDEPGLGASFGNAGNFNISSVVPTALPGMLKQVPRWLSDPTGPLSVRWAHLPSAIPWLIRFIRAGSRERVIKQARALRALLGGWHEHLMPLVKQAHAEDLVRRDGTLIVYRTEESFRRASFGYGLRRDNGIEMQLLTGHALWDFEPAISHDYHVGLYVAGNGNTLNPHRLVQKLVEAFVKAGGTIHKARASGFAFHGAQLTGVSTDNGVLKATRAVVAAGIHSRSLAAMLGDRIPLESERGYHLMLRDPESVPRLPISDMDGKFVASPMELGLRLAGTVEIAGLRAAPDWRRSRVLLTQARRLLPGLSSQHAETRFTMWMGHRPSTPDSLPVIGRSRRSPDVIYAFGHGHTGMAGAPTTAALVADLLAAREPRIRLELFDAQRF
jgi:D-amino-acid dehydrogenase